MDLGHLTILSDLVDRENAVSVSIKYTLVSGHVVSGWDPRSTGLCSFLAKLNTLCLWARCIAFLHRGASC